MLGYLDASTGSMLVATAAAGFAGAAVAVRAGAAKFRRKGRRDESADEPIANADAASDAPVAEDLPQT